MRWLLIPLPPVAVVEQGVLAGGSGESTEVVIGVVEILEDRVDQVLVDGIAAELGSRAVELYRRLVGDTD